MGDLCKMLHSQLDWSQTSTAGQQTDSRIMSKSSDRKHSINTYRAHKEKGKMKAEYKE